MIENLLLKQLFLEILKNYKEYLEQNPQTIFARCVGLHSIKVYGLVKYFVVMEIECICCKTKTYRNIVRFIIL